MTKLSRVTLVPTVLRVRGGGRKRVARLEAARGYDLELTSDGIVVKAEGCPVQLLSSAVWLACEVEVAKGGK